MSSMGIYRYKIFQDSFDFENVARLSPKVHANKPHDLTCVSKMWSLQGRWEPESSASPHGPAEHSRHRSQTTGLSDWPEERDLLVPLVRHIRRPGPRRRT